VTDFDEEDEEYDRGDRAGICFQCGGECDSEQEICQKCIESISDFDEAGICFQCGGECDSEQEICQECRESISGDFICPECGNIGENYGGQDLCSECYYLYETGGCSC